MAVFTVFTLGVILRVAASSGDFSMDEIWSWHLVNRVHHPLHIITRLPHDNNHILNSLFMYSMGGQAFWQVYRIPSVIAGVMSLILAFRIGLRGGKRQALFLLILLGPSFLAVFYSAEARGYGLLMFFTLAAYGISLRVLEEQDTRQMTVAGLWGSVVLGVLSHLSFIYVYAGILVWSLDVILRSGGSRREKIVQLARLHLVPMLFLVWLTAVFISPMKSGGAPEADILSVIGQTAVYILGLKQAGWFRAAGGIILFIVGVSGLYLVRRHKGSRWLFFATATICAPALSLLVFPVDWLAIRYFLVSIILYYFLVAQWLDDLFGRTRFGAWSAILILGLYVIGQAGFFASYFPRQKGQFARTVAFLADKTRGRSVTVGGHHDFRNALVFRFYKKRTGGASRLQYVPHGRWNERDPQYYLLEDLLSRYRFRTIEITIEGRPFYFRHLKSFPFGGHLAGWDWHVYERFNPLPDDQ